MENNGETGEFFHDSVEDIECQRRGNEFAFFVAGALFGGEFVGTVACADRDSKRVTTCAGSEVDYFFGIGIGVVVRRNFVFNAGENAEFAFDCYVKLVSVVTYLLVRATFSS